MQKKVENNDLNIDFRFLRKLDDNKPVGLPVLTSCTTCSMYIRKPSQIKFKEPIQWKLTFPRLHLGKFVPY